jgi:putative ABC transport system ATP-binding protein
MPLLELHNVTKRLGNTRERTFTLHIPEFTLEATQHLALVGASGSGKTTLLHLISGIVRADAGSIRIAGTDTTTLTEARRDRFRAQHIGIVHQTFNLLQGLTARENVLVATMFADNKEAEERTNALLERLGLGAKMHNKPRELSIGEQQRVAVARALVNKPALILADEPTASVDAPNAARVIGEMRAVASEEGASILTITHDAAVQAMFPESVQIQDVVKSLEGA